MWLIAQKTSTGCPPYSLLNHANFYIFRLSSDPSSATAPAVHWQIFSARSLKSGKIIISKITRLPTKVPNLGCKKSTNLTLSIRELGGQIHQNSVHLNASGLAFQAILRLISNPIYLVRTLSWRVRIVVIKTLLCGCVYDENEWMLVRVKECEKHHKQRTRKREYRPKAECNRNDTRGE